MAEEPSAQVSVIIPAFNAESTIENCIKSAQAQTIPVLEILIYDDRSDDETASIVTRMAESDPRIKLFCGQHNQGAGVARSCLLEAAVGDVFAFLDADDRWYPEKISRQLDLLARESADIVTSAYDIVDQHLNVIGRRNAPRKITYAQMLFTNWLPTSMTIVKAGVLGARDMPELRRRQDYGYWLSLFAQNKNIKCVACQKPLGLYTRTPGSLSSSRLTNIKSNFIMFRTILGYNLVLSIMLVALNGCARAFRS